MSGSKFSEISRVDPGRCRTSTLTSGSRVATWGTNQKASPIHALEIAMKSRKHILPFALLLISGSALAQEDVHHRWQVYEDLARRWPAQPGTRSRDAFVPRSQPV